MAYRLQDDEDTTRRRTAVVAIGRRFWRTYDVSNAPEDVISEGDPMPGSTGDDDGNAAPLLGPFVEEGGIAYAEDRKSGRQTVTLRCIELTPLTAGDAGAFIAIKPFNQNDAGDNTTFTTVGVAATDTAVGVPGRGDVLTGTNPQAYCVDVQKDYLRFPQRVTFTIQWRVQRRV
jgi:hypothetical protein